MTVPFKDIQFGFASAEVESTEAPRLLVEAFLDSQDIVREAIHGPKLLILGPKGSGKSALGLHLSLIASQRSGLFVTRSALGDLSLQALGGIAAEESESELRYLRAWSWVLLLNLMGSLVQDQGALPSDVRAYESAVAVLRKRGLLPVRDLADLVGKSALRNFEISAFGVDFTGDADRGQDRLTISAAANALKEILANARTRSRHLLVIDGLDDVLLDAEFQLEALSALVLEATRLNQYFRERNAAFKIVLLCRTDVYERLPGSNQNKVRQDLSLELDWFNESSSPSKSHLLQLIQLRAQLADPHIDNVIDAYFPRRLHRTEAVKALLQLTRHTPRDLIQLLRYVQGAMTDGRLVEFSDFNAGVRAYAEKYFLPELSDELDGQIKRRDTEKLMEVLRHFHRHEFKESELRDFLVTRPDAASLDLDRILRAMYTAGAIGNLFIDHKGTRRYTFRFRNRGSAYSRNDSIVVHQALRRALQLM